LADGSLIFDTKLDSSGFKKGLEALGSIGTTALKGTVAAIGAVSAGVAGIGTAAVKSYAEYEQLIGGVNTLFKDSSGALMDYAANAFSTAGLSANDYMETVTSFSASLLQSLEGDTAAAVEYANMAITDMSDNANKMGTDMAMIQNAYQGFAKQNYTMLDNLKLGYGGTKEEMERLIQEAAAMEDAQKRLGVTVDASSLSFSNIVTAIHVVQDEMGIAEATLQEAATTIQGSAAAMKAAWENLLVGFADSNQNLPTLIDNFVNTVVTYLGNLVPRIEETAPRIIEAIGAMFSGAAPLAAEMLAPIAQSVLNVIPEIVQAATELGSSLISTLQQNLPQIAQSAIEIGVSLIDGLLTILPDILVAGVQLIGELAVGIGQALPELIPAAVDAVLTLVEGLTSGETIGLLIEGAAALIVGLAEGLIAALPELISRIPEIVSSLVTALVSNAPLLMEAAVTLMGALIEGLITLALELPMVGLEIIGNLVTGLIENKDNLLQAGKDLIQGLIDGIAERASKIWDYIKGYFEGIPERVKGIFGIHSPSTVFAKIGGYLMDGLAGGMADGSPEALSEVEKLAAEMLGIAESDFPAFVESAVSTISELPAKIWDWLLQVVERVKDFASQIVNTSKSEIPKFVNSIVETISQLPAKVWTWLQQVIQRVKEWASDLINTAKSEIPKFVNGVVEGISEMAGKVWDKLGETIQKVKDWASELISTAKSEIPRFVENVVDSFMELPAKIADIGKNLVEGLWNGISGMTSWIGEKISGFVQGLFDSAKDEAEIKSPSRRAAREIGKPFAQGIGVGLEDEMPRVFERMRRAVDSQMQWANRAATTSGGVSTTTNNNTTTNAPVMHFHHPVQTPYETARAVRNTMRDLVYG